MQMHPSTFAKRLSIDNVPLVGLPWWRRSDNLSLTPTCVPRSLGRTISEHETSLYMSVDTAGRKDDGPTSIPEQASLL